VAVCCASPEENEEGEKEGEGIQGVEEKRGSSISSPKSVSGSRFAGAAGTVQADMVSTVISKSSTLHP